MNNIRKLAAYALIPATTAFAGLRAAQADINFDVQIASVSGPGVTVLDSHTVNVSQTGGTINFNVYAEVTNSTGVPASNDAFQDARGYIQAGLAAGAGNVPGNNGPIGNLTNGTMVFPFNAEASVGPPGSGASLFTTGVVDLNGNGFTDFGNLANDVNLDVIPRSKIPITNAANGGSSNFKFFSFSMPVTSLGTLNGSTALSFVNNSPTIGIQWAEAGVPKTARNGTIAPPVSSIANGVAPPAAFLVDDNAYYPDSSPTIAGSVYASGGASFAPTSSGSISLATGGAAPAFVELAVQDSSTNPISANSLPGGSVIDLTAGSLDPDAQLIANSDPWANTLIRYNNTSANPNFSFSFSSGSIDRIAAVPEPGTLAFFSLATLPLLSRRKRNKPAR